MINRVSRTVSRTIKLGLPISVPGQNAPAYGAAPVGIGIDTANNIAYVSLYNANAIAVVDLSTSATQPVMGLIPVAYAPGSVQFDKAHGQLIVANDKGVGTLASFETDYGVTGYNTHQDTGTVSIVRIPTSAALASLTKKVYQNNHWDLTANIVSAGSGSSATAPVAIPAHIGDPSLIKHIFLIIRENRTYDQVLGDVAAGSGDAQLAVFGGKDTPNMHNAITRFPLLDNFYDPSRQSADGHQWITEAMAPYQDDIQAPDWVRSYPGGNAGDALAYLPKGFLFQATVNAGLSTKLYGEYSEQEFWPTPLGHPTLVAAVCRLAGVRIRPGNHAEISERAGRHVVGAGGAEPPGEELPDVRPEHSRPVARGPLAAGFQQGRGRRHGSGAERAVDHGRPYRWPADAGCRTGR